MKQWSIYLYPFEDEQPHPVVILSNDERCENKQLLHVNGLICSTVRGGRDPKKHEIFLDERDGLEWKTAVRCDYFYALPKSKFMDCRGAVSEARRKIIVRKIIECLRLPFF